MGFAASSGFKERKKEAMKALQTGPGLAGSPSPLLQCEQIKNQLYSPRSECSQQQGRLSGSAMGRGAFE